MLDDAGTIRPDEDEVGPVPGLVLTDVPGGGLLWEFHGSSVPPDAYGGLRKPPGEFHSSFVPPGSYGGIWTLLDDAGTIRPDEDKVGPVPGLVLTDVPGGGLLWEFHGSSVPPDAYFGLCIAPGEFHSSPVPPDSYGGIPKSRGADDWS